MLRYLAEPTNLGKGESNFTLIREERIDWRSEIRTVAEGRHRLDWPTDAATLGGAAASAAFASRDLVDGHRQQENR